MSAEDGRPGVRQCISTTEWRCRAVESLHVALEIDWDGCPWLCHGGLRKRVRGVQLVMHPGTSALQISDWCKYTLTFRPPL